MLNFIDNLLNKITMYRLVLYFLIVLLAVAAIFGALGVLSYSPIAIIFSTLFLIAVAWIANGIFAAIFKAHPNVESVYITSLILALIITPAMPTDTNKIIFLACAAVFAMASKYIFAINRKHIFNPAAFGVALCAFTISQYASWWVGGNLPLLAFVLIGGFLVIRKVQRFDLAIAFLIGAAMSYLATRSFVDPLGTLQKVAVHTPLFFFASIMITEPLTTPPTRSWRIIYGALVGLIFAPQIHLGPIYSTPEIALIAGNIFSYAVSPKKKYVLKLKERKPVGGAMYDFSFSGAQGLKFAPGQYMEWTLAHKGSDGRGNRRYFTIASSPTEDDVRLGVRFYEPGSSFKKALLDMKSGETILAGQIAGDFTLPSDQNHKLAFIAGGIGITPFRSIIKYLADKKEQRDIVMLYSVRTLDELAYHEVFDEAEAAIPLKTVYAITDIAELPKADMKSERFHKGFIDVALIKKEIPDYRERIFYISGPRAMTEAFRKSLGELGVPRKNIRIDFFPGFA